MSADYRVIAVGNRTPSFHGQNGRTYDVMVKFNKDLPKHGDETGAGIIRTPAGWFIGVTNGGHRSPEAHRTMREAIEAVAPTIVKEFEEYQAASQCEEAERAAALKAALAFREHILDVCNKPGRPTREDLIDVVIYCKTWVADDHGGPHSKMRAALDRFAAAAQADKTGRAA